MDMRLLAKRNKCIHGVRLSRDSNTERKDGAMKVARVCACL
jgi:hypothetical protein